ncbi:MAG: alpha-glucosidase [Lachnospiraceae bacterium]|nr:alpha-glucosidase [Lachnospiraceae bacterium]
MSKDTTSAAASESSANSGQNEGSSQTESTSATQAKNEVDSTQTESNPKDSSKETSELKWWQTTNVCEIYVRSYYDTNDDGIGDLNGITEKLDYLRDSGIGAIWLTPCYKSPQADNGYDISDYYDIDETFGSMEDMDRLLVESEEKGIKIIMDLVFNHTSNQNEWFLESSSSRDNPKADWYIWRDPKPDGSAPTNWRSIFGGSAWTWCEERGQYYLHTFLEEQPDLNWENPDVRNALFDVANFWLDRGVDGFRMDAVTYIKKPEFKDGKVDGADGLSSVHNMTANTDGILDFLHEFKKEVQEGKDIFTVGEANGVSTSELPLWVGKDGVFDSLFEFTHIIIDLADDTDWSKRRQWTLKDFKGYLTQSQENTAENGWSPIFFENHDQPRCIDHYFPNTSDENMAGKIIGTLMFTLRGTPFVYQGQEIGLRNVKWNDINDYNDINTINHYKYLIEHGHSKEEAMEAVHHFSRDSARTPMQWSAEDNAGFTRGKPWLPVSDDYKTRNVAVEEEDPDSILSWYRTMADIRASHPELVDGSYEEILKDNEQIYAFIRKNDSAQAIVLLNFSEEPAEYDPSIIDGAELIISSREKDNQAGKLAPLESAVYEIK